MTHDEAWLLLPWYANGTLTEAERLTVETHLEECARCKGELAQLGQVSREMATHRASQSAPAPQRIEGVQARIRSDKVVSLSGSRRDRAAKQWHAIPRFARVALAAQLLLVVGLTSWIGDLSRDGSATTAAGGDDGRARIAVSFQPGITEEVLRRVVQDARGVIVDGPSALGLYTLALDVPAESTAVVDQVLAGLRRDSTVVRFAERAP